MPSAIIAMLSCIAHGSPSSTTEIPNSRVWHFIFALPCLCRILRAGRNNAENKHFRPDVLQTSSAVDGLQGTPLRWRIEIAATYIRTLSCQRGR